MPHAYRIVVPTARQPVKAKLAMCSTLSAQRHDGIDDIIVILLQRLDRLLPRNARLRHDQLDILGLEPGIIHLLALILVVVLLAVAGVDRLAFAVLVRMVVAGVRVAAAGSGVVGRGQVLRRLMLRGLVEVFDLGLAEDAAS